MEELTLKERVQVVVRCRPMNIKEITSNYRNVVDILPFANSIQIFNPKERDIEGKTFTFDAVYDSSSTQESLYKQSVQPVIKSVLKGFNGTIFAYGQTGTGKTFTMEGKGLDSYQKGVIPRVFEQIFSHISQSENVQYLVRASYVEIYQEEVKDLLDESGDKYHELAGDGSGIYIKNLKSQICKSVKEMEKIMKRGKRNRKVGATDMNEHSSRSHAIFIITIEMSRMTSHVNHIKVGKLNLVDLAGSERQSKSSASGERLKEASKINLSLSALGNVISALSSGKNFHVPYRDSKLTRLLQDSLGGNSKTLMIANIGPACYNYDESLTTLRYAKRAKNIKNKPVVNEDPKDALIKKYQDEIRRLKDLVKSKLSLENKPKLLAVNNQKLNPYNMDANNFSLPLSNDKKIGEAEQQTIKIHETNQNIVTLKSKIHSMESRLLQGTDILQHTNKQKKDLQQHEEEIKQRAQRKSALEQQLEKEEETTEELQDSNTSLQTYIENKLENLNRLHDKIKMVRNQTADIEEEFSKDRNDLEVAQNELIKEHKLNQIIIDNFILASDRQKFMSSVQYNEESEEWKVNYSTKSIHPRVFSSYYQRHPESEYSKILAKLNHDFRYKTENIIDLELEHQVQPRNEYQSPQVPVTVKYAFEEALRKEDDITVDASSTRGNKTLKQGRKSFDQLDKNLCTRDCNIYPKVRGLVKRK